MKYLLRLQGVFNFVSFYLSSINPAPVAPTGTLHILI